MSPESYSRSHSIGRFSSRCFVYPFPLKYFPTLFPSILAAVQINQFVLVTDFCPLSIRNFVVFVGRSVATFPTLLLRGATNRCGAERCRPFV